MAHIFFHPIENVTTQKSNGWLARLLSDSIDQIRLDNPHVNLPKKIGAGGWGDDFCWITYNRKEVRDCFIRHFTNHKLVTLELVRTLND